MSSVQAVQLFGTNWQLLERIFPGRPRRALKNKFRAEQRRDAGRMDAALAGTPSSIEQYRQIISILRARPAAACYSCQCNARRCGERFLVVFSRHAVQQHAVPLDQQHVKAARLHCILIQSKMRSREAVVAARADMLSSPTQPRQRCCSAPL